MLPLILGVVGGYLIGDSMKGKAIFEDGGVMDEFDLDEYDPIIIRNVVLKALSENDGSGYDVENKEFNKHYIHSLTRLVKYNEDLSYIVKFSYELYKDKYDGYYDYKVTVDGDDVDMDIFTKEENDLIEYELEGLRESLHDILSN